MKNILFFQEPILTKIDFENNTAISCCNEDGDRWIQFYDLNIKKVKESFLFNFADDFIGGDWSIQPIELIDWQGEKKEEEALRFLLNFLKGG